MRTRTDGLNDNQKRLNKKKQIDDLLKSFNIDESMTGMKLKGETVVYDSFERSLFPRHGYNFMCDLIIMPENKEYEYILVVLDLWSRQFDLEPMKDKKAVTTLKHFKKILSRSYITKKNMLSMSSDNGGEFLKEFGKFLKQNSIFHKRANPGRHKQLQPIDSLIQTIMRFLNGSMIADEIKTGVSSSRWVEIIDQFKKQLNVISLRKDGDPYDISRYSRIDDEFTDDNSKFKIGDEVLRKLDRPENTFGKTQNGKFRTGDFRWSRKPETVEFIYHYPKTIRYRLSNFHHVAYTEQELRLA